MSDSLRSLKTNERIPHSLIFGEKCELIAQVAHQKWAIERITRFLSELLIRSIFRSFAQKTDEEIPSPDT